MATVRPRVFETPERESKAKGEVIKEEFKITPEMLAANLVEFIEDKNAQFNLEYADVIVSGGKGLGNPEGFKLIKELADELGGVVGSSRAAVDGGWIDYEHQVGRLENMSVLSSILPPASPALSSTKSACRIPTISWPSTPIQKHLFLKSPPWAWWETSTRSSRK